MGVVVLLGLCAAAAAAYVLLHHGEAATASGAAKALNVAVVRVARQDVAQALTVAAEFRPYQEVALHAKIAGYLQSISVDVGDQVREGQVLAQLDVPELKNELEKASAALGASQQEVIRSEAGYKEAHLACTRLQDVAKDHPRLVAQQELDVIQAKDATAAGALAVARQKVEEATAEVSKVRSMMAYTTIAAPFAGVVTRRGADPGALVQAGTSSSGLAPLLDIAEDKRLRLVFPVPESAASLVKVGALVHVTVSSLGEKFEAKVSRYSGKIDRTTRTMLTEAEIDNHEGRFTPGMYASVSLVLRESKGAVAVPVQAVAIGENPKVLVVNGAGTIEEHSIKLGLETPFLDEVLNGLAPGDQVIVGSRAGLQAGQKVTPKPIELAPAE